jgi:hypothetical protein
VVCPSLTEREWSEFMHPVLDPCLKIPLIQIGMGHRLARVIGSVPY